MRVVVLFIMFAAACTPEIISGAYLCGPDGACPDGLACSGESGTCRLPTQVQPFACEPMLDTEPDNSAAEAYSITLQCVSVPFVSESCMPEGDDADWLTFVAPTQCIAVEVQARLSFPISFADLGLELWNLDTDTRLATDTDCVQAGGSLGDVRRCIDFELVGGTRYGIKVHRTGEGTCDGACSFNSYRLTVGTATPG
jgi:hypothetical protein